MEKTPGVFVQNKEFRVKSYFIPSVEDTDINSFYWNLRNDLENFIESSFKASKNLSNQEKTKYIRVNKRGIYKRR